VTAERLSALDASFLAVETESAPMHVGWVATFEPPEHGSAPGFEELFARLAGRLGGAPRYRQKLVSVPLGLHDPVWVDDAGFDARTHVRHAEGGDLGAIADLVLSSPLARGRPLWEIWIADQLSAGGFALVGKMHHCMVDGIALAELGKLVLDASPDAPAGAEDSAGGWTARPLPRPGELMARALRERARNGAELALAPVRLAGSPARVLGLPGAAGRGARTLAHTLLPPAPDSPLNRPGSVRRRHIRVSCPLEDVRAVRRRHRVTPNDVVLAGCAGALRRFAERRGEKPRPLKAMIPADVRTSGDAAGTGNRIAFLFVTLPCDEPDPVERLRAIHRATAQRERDGEAADVDAAFRALALTPGPVQHLLARAFAHPRLFNLTISTVPGPAVSRYLLGCRLREVYSAVPLARRHALSIGVVLVAGRACFGIYADAAALPDADAFGADLERSLEELFASGRRAAAIR
jgi:diacylglycerol O-acyltransferase / wax synthase